MKHGFYPGSFDPPTFGHLDIIVRALRFVDKLTIAIGVHDTKKPFLSADERMVLVGEITQELALKTGREIEIITFSDLTVNAARRTGADIMIRGLRDASDFDYEVQLGQMNIALDGEIETVFLAASAATRMLSSSLVKQVALMGGDISAFAPENVCKHIGQKL